MTTVATDRGAARGEPRLRAARDAGQRRTLSGGLRGDGRRVRHWIRIRRSPSRFLIQAQQILPVTLLGVALAPEFIFKQTEAPRVGRAGGDPERVAERADLERRTEPLSVGARSATACRVVRASCARDVGVHAGARARPARRPRPRSWRSRARDAGAAFARRSMLSLVRATSRSRSVGAEAVAGEPDVEARDRRGAQSTDLRADAGRRVRVCGERLVEVHRILTRPADPLERSGHRPWIPDRLQRDPEIARCASVSIAPGETTSNSSAASTNSRSFALSRRSEATVSAARPPTSPAACPARLDDAPAHRRDAPDRRHAWRCAR